MGEPSRNGDWKPRFLFDLEGFPLDHVSVSQLRTFYMCGLRWWYQTVSETPVFRVGWDAMLRGTALDRAANAHFNKKAEDGEGLRKQTFIEMAVHVHEEGEDTHMFDIAETKSRDRTAKIAKEYRETFADMFQPWAKFNAQDKIKYKDEDLLLPVHGVIDLRTVGNGVVDNKVKKKVPSITEVHADLQLTTYAMMTGAEDVALAVITDSDRPKAEYLPSKRTPDQVANVKYRYNEMIRQVKAGILHPAPEGSWYCCNKWCAYWNQCPFGDAQTNNENYIPGL